MLYAGSMADVHMRDFTRKRKKIRFQIDKDTFEAKPSLSVQVIDDLLTVASSISDDNNSTKDYLHAVEGVLQQVLTPSCVDRFMARLWSKDDDAFDFEQVISIVSWLLEIYAGGYPTKSSSSESDSSDQSSDGDASTDGASPEVSATPAI